MSSLAADLAIFERLTGAPLDGQGRPLLGSDGRPKNRLLPGIPDGQQTEMRPSFGFRIPEVKHPYDLKHNLSSQTPDAIRLFDKGFERHAYRYVKVFSENLPGRAWADTWPAVTFRRFREKPNRETYIFDDPIRTDAGQLVTIKNEFGDDVQTGYDRELRRSLPDAYDLYYTIRLHSKSEIEVTLMEHCLKYLFPQVTGLLISFADGTSHACDMFMENIAYQDPGDERDSESPDEQKHYLRVYTYRVEGYMDNSVNGFGTEDIVTQRRVTQRLLELQDLQGQVGENPGDLNKKELETLE